jgi:SSS family transporter
MGILDIIIIIFFSLGIVCAGLAFTRQGKNMKSFFAAGGSMPWYMSGLSLFMGFFSAGTFVVWGSIAYSQGWVAVTIQWTMAVAGFVVGTFIAPRWHRTGALTVAEYINKRLGASTQKIYTYLFLFISLFLTASFLYPIAKILQVSTGLPLELCILLLSVFCILYVSAGGLRAVIVTDILQFVILTIAVIIVIPMSLHKIDGFSTLIQSAPDTFFNLFNAEYSIGFIIAFTIYNTIFLGGNWAYVQRYTCVPTARDSKKAGWLFGVLYIVSPVLWMLPPMLYKAINPTLAGLESEGAYLLMCKEVLTSGIMGLMIGGMIFATTSAINSKLNIVAGVFTNDIFKRLKPNSPGKTLMFSARLSTIVFGILTIVIAMLIPKMGGVVNVVISLAALTGVPLYLPVVWTLFSKRQTAISNLTSTVLSLAVNGIFKFVTPVFGFSLNRAEEMILGVTFPVLCLSAFEIYYLFKHKISGHYESYVAWEKENQTQHIKPDAIQAINKENKFSNKIVGYGIAITGLIVALLGGVASNGVALVVTTGTVFAMLGIYLIKKSFNR